MVPSFRLKIYVVMMRLVQNTYEELGSRSHAHFLEVDMCIIVAFQKKYYSYMGQLTHKRRGRSTHDVTMSQDHGCL
jgi:hypothetical protein